MAKDPAFPFYASDYLVDTMRWSRDMKALHVDLMAECWINGPLENEGGYPRGLTKQDVKIWDKIKDKWQLDEDSNWVNSKLEDVRQKRLMFKEKQRENGFKGGRPRKESSIKKEDMTSINETQNKPKPYLEKNLLEDESGNENENLNQKGNENSKDEIFENSGFKVYLIPEMLIRWKKHLPEYPDDYAKDASSLQSLAKFICKVLDVNYDPANGEVLNTVLEYWDILAEFISKQEFFRNYSISQVDRHSQNVIQTFNNEHRKTNLSSTQHNRTFIQSETAAFGKL